MEARLFARTVGQTEVGTLGSECPVGSAREGITLSKRQDIDWTLDVPLGALEGNTTRKG